MAYPTLLYAIGGGRPIPKLFEQFGNIGVDLVSFYPLDIFTYCEQPATDSTAAIYDYSGLDRHFNAIVEANPKAYIFPRLNIGMTPHWWDSSYEDELVVFDDGSRVPFMLKNQNLTVPSFSSVKW